MKIATLALFVLPVSFVGAIHMRWIGEIAKSGSKRPPRFVVETATGPLIFDAAAKVPLLSPSATVAEAVIRSEDPRFFERNHSLDLISVGGAIEDAIRGNPRGASTIEQQLARLESPWILQPERSAYGFAGWAKRFTRKILEVRIGDHALQSRGHLEILRDYCSLVPTPTPGVEAAALREFGKPASELSPQEATALTALFPAPGRRIRNRTEWQAAAARRDPAVIVPRVPVCGHVFPFGSILRHANRKLDPEATRSAFLLAHKHLRSNSDLEEISVVALRGGTPFMLIDSARAGVREPWPSTTAGLVRMNSLIKVFEATMLLNAHAEPPGLGHALEHSLNDPFRDWGTIFGRTLIERRLEVHGLTNRQSFSVLGRIWTPPLDLVRAVQDCVSNRSRLRVLLSEVPRRGTAASMLRTWPGLPRSAWAKTGTSPNGTDFLIVGGSEDITVLIWAKAKRANDHEAGPVLGPLLATVLREFKSHPPKVCSTTSALSLR